MSFTPALSLFIGMGIMVGVVSALFAIIVDRIDTKISERSVEKALAARRARKAREARRTWEEQSEDYHGVAMGLLATRALD
ncbi:hypothetical protein [Paraburkholderia rhizosphaerae]|uniref:Uncharacterized protein n=1 Tax=Paraburkholderia rhizosphaerae TaxID=480658 RepID=A0A4R8LH06_9BURK|nr:hypothetical protein [Paraburkholderia rhizosphaerae]TDY42446.1 hypothetical protein BX592_12117 [Paraburkholderia rhizosphaerae]